MAKKVTISIPDMLHEKLEKWRESFNLSKMFQDAVSDAIQKKEEFQKVQVLPQLPAGGNRALNIYGKRSGKNSKACH